MIVVNHVGKVQQRRIVRLKSIIERIDEFCDLVHDGWSLQVAANKCGFNWLYWRNDLLQFPRVERVYNFHMTRTKHKIANQGCLK